MLLPLFWRICMWFALTESDIFSLSFFWTFTWNIQLPQKIAPLHGDKCGTQTHPNPQIVDICLLEVLTVLSRSHVLDERTRVLQGCESPNERMVARIDWWFSKSTNYPVDLCFSLNCCSLPSLSTLLHSCCGSYYALSPSHCWFTWRGPCMEVQTFWLCGCTHVRKNHPAAYE